MEKKREKHTEKLPSKLEYFRKVVGSNPSARKYFFPARFLLNCTNTCILKEHRSIDKAERYCNGLIMKCFTISSLFKKTKIVSVG